MLEHSVSCIYFCLLNSNISEEVFWSLMLRVSEYYVNVRKWWHVALVRVCINQKRIQVWIWIALASFPFLLKSCKQLAVFRVISAELGFKEQLKCGERIAPKQVCRLSWETWSTKVVMSNRMKRLIKFLTTVLTVCG